MNAANIRDFIAQEPFTPFRVVLTSGTVYDIRDAQSAVALKHELFVVFDDGERWAHVPFLHIAAIETVRNGSRHRRRKRS